MFPLGAGKMRPALGLALATAMLACAGSAKADDCGTFPKEVREQSIYGGFADCALKKLGEPPLWKGLPSGTAQVMRFTFTDGHALFFRAVTIIERQDGTTELIAVGTQRRSGIGTPERRLPVHRRRLSAEQIARIHQLAEQAEPWNFAVGTWDGDEAYLHCQTLDMERANAAGYRFSSVNISCNQPSKLMPLVHEIASLAGLQIDGAVFY